MENKLNLLFDFQKFSQNERLNKIIDINRDKSESSVKKLTIDNLDLVNAAGDISADKKYNVKDNKNDL